MKNKNLNFILFVLLIMLFGCIYIYKTVNENSNAAPVNLNTNLKVSFLDVGQADAILIQDGQDNMLIDAGNTEDGPKLVTYLKNNGIDTFKYVVGTHAHEDHIGGMSDIVNNFTIENYYMPDVLTTTKTFEDLLDALNNKNIKLQTPSINDTFTLNNANFKVLYVGTDSENLNNSSIVLKMTYGNMKFLFMGDATNTVEKAIINDDLAADVLKVGHHGSSTSSSQDFLNKVSPKYAVISVGKDNTYNLPSAKTITKLDNLNVKVYRTDELGTIIMQSDGNTIDVTTINADTNG
jgi:competence protein ComEC